MHVVVQLFVPLPGPELRWAALLLLLLLPPGEEGGIAKWVGDETEAALAVATRVATLRLARPAGKEAAETAFLFAAPRGTAVGEVPDPPRAAPSARCRPAPWCSSSRCLRS